MGNVKSFRLEYCYYAYNFYDYVDKIKPLLDLRNEKAASYVLKIKMFMIITFQIKHRYINTVVVF